MRFFFSVMKKERSLVRGKPKKFLLKCFLVLNCCCWTLCLLLVWEHSQSCSLYDAKKKSPHESKNPPSDHKEIDFYTHFEKNSHKYPRRRLMQLINLSLFIQDSSRRKLWSIHSMQLCRRKIQSLSNAKQKVTQCRKSNGTRTVNSSRRAHINSYFPMEICFSSVSCTHVATVRKAIPVFIGVRQEMRSEWREVEMRRYKLLVSVPFQALNFSLVLFQSQHGNDEFYFLQFFFPSHIFFFVSCCQSSVQPLQPHLNLMIEENVLLLTFISYHRMKYGSDLMFSYFSPFLIAAALFCRR